MLKFKLKIPEKIKKGFKNPKNLFRIQLQAAINDSAIAVQGEIKRNIIPGWNMGHKTRNPYFTGRLNRSITVKTGVLKATVGTNLPYAAIQEYGGDIRPVTAKALFVPLSILGRKVGPIKGGSPLLKYGKDFIFMQKVTIKPKAYFERGADAATPFIMKRLQEAVQSAGLEFGLKE